MSDNARKEESCEEKGDSETSHTRTKSCTIGIYYAHVYEPKGMSMAGTPVRRPGKTVKAPVRKAVRSSAKRKGK